MRQIKIVAHRGIRGLFTENSLASFKAAASSGADLIEFDVQATRDGQLVVCHSMESPKRVFGITRPINEMDWQQVQQYKSPGGERMPTLGEVLGVLKDKPIMIDVKDMASAQLLADGQALVGTQNVKIFNSLLPEALALLKTKQAGRDLSLQTYKNPFAAIKKARQLGLSHITLVLYLLNPLTYWLARRNSLQVITYQNYASFLLTWRWFVGILGIFYPSLTIVSDRPDKLVSRPE